MGERGVKSDSDDGSKGKIRERFLVHNKGGSRKRVQVMSERNDGDIYKEEYRSDT